MRQIHWYEVRWFQPSECPPFDLMPMREDFSQESNAVVQAQELAVQQRTEVTVVRIYYYGTKREEQTIRIIPAPSGAELKALEQAEHDYWKD